MVCGHWTGAHETAASYFPRQPGAVRHLLDPSPDGQEEWRSSVAYGSPDVFRAAGLENVTGLRSVSASTAGDGAVRHH